jgi:hypothetical protein
VTDLKALMELSTKVTPLPWYLDAGDDEHCCSIDGIISEAEQKRINTDTRLHLGDFPLDTKWVAVNPGCAPVELANPDADFAYIVAACNAVPGLIQRLQAAEDENERLKQCDVGGDMEAQALAWLDVYRELRAAGIESFFCENFSGRGRAIAFIRHLAERAALTPPTKGEEKR